MILHSPPGSPPLLVAGPIWCWCCTSAAGVVGIAAGMAALVLRKAPGARWAGNVFFVSMLIYGRDRSGRVADDPQS